MGQDQAARIAELEAQNAELREQLEDAVTTLQGIESLIAVARSLRKPPQ